MSEESSDDFGYLGGEEEPSPGEYQGESADLQSFWSLEDKDRFLTHDDASKCLHTLGKCDRGYGYAYLAMEATNRRLTDVSVIPNFRNVIYVNVSGNKLTIEALRVLTSMTYLLMLQADRNELTSTSMDPMLYLQVLCLNRNFITDTSGINHRLLECLELNFNRIATVTLNPYILENLKVLELRGNKLSTTDGIFLPSLVHLYLAENEIRKVEGLETLINLKILHLRGNRLENLDGFDARCAKLSYLNLRQNGVLRLAEFGKLSSLKGLEELIVQENPVMSADEEVPSQFRIAILCMLPNLKRIDKDVVVEDELKEAEEMRQRMKDEGVGFSEIDLFDVKDS
ncbi:leucine-rich repeat-containing protein 23-like [Orussus abietinus]|uniref:leucine-rich repeat-containing protein 23-like n=1 Tax=Orussus abietinus TaxID=222816 RepID=UPI000626E94E|nr:leucine-rich repeat-containing protein 23-like [Orussus abietinus]